MDGGRTNSARLVELVQQPEFCDLHIFPDRPGTTSTAVRASRLLLAAASPALERQLHAARRGAAPTARETLRWPVDAEVAKAVVAYSCGVPAPFARLDAAAARRARQLLRTGEVTREDEQDDLPTNHKKSGGSSLLKLLMVLMILASLLAYWPIREFNLETGGFFMDDAMIRRNSLVTDGVLDWRRLWRTDYWGLEMFDPQTWTHKSFRPLTVLTFRWNFLWHGFNSGGFHGTNALLHGLCSLQLAHFGRKHLQLPTAWAGLLACLFAAHPVHTESICYVVGRADILCAQVLFFALEVYGPRRPTARPRLAARALRTLLAAALIVVSGLCKETGEDERCVALGT
ncbi:unnamed protein product [Durusdinium trenchii]|uniref:GPI mannosyltransferase 2 n=1 Tax=Durusdinium trenchii TaxID=1381693 RepID=A0ABP0QIH2_9DINO